MNDDMFNELLTSLGQANDIIQGQAKAARVTTFAEPEVKAIRAKTGLSQRCFARVVSEPVHP